MGAGTATVTSSIKVGTRTGTAPTELRTTVGFGDRGLPAAPATLGAWMLFENIDLWDGNGEPGALPTGDAATIESFRSAERRPAELCLPTAAAF